MLRFPLADDWSLLLTPRFGALGEPWQAIVLLLLALVPPGLLVWLYRYEMRLVRARTAVLLLSLRLVLIVLLWLVLALEPVLRHTTTEELPGRVLLALDRSGSMEVPDPQRPIAEKLRLARALNLTPPQPLAPGELDRWIAAHEQSSQEGRTLQLTREEQAQLDDLCRQVDRLTRREIMRRVLADSGMGFLSRLRQKHRVELLAFHQQVWDVTPENALSAEPGPKEPGGSAPAFTDLRQPLLRALERTSPDQPPVSGVVLFSDGQHNWGDDPLDTVEKLAQRKVPIHVVALGARGTPPDVSVLELTGPANVFKDAEARIEARIKVSGLPAQDIVVELHEGQKPPGEEDKKILRHDGQDRIYEVTFQRKMEQVGTHRFEIRTRTTRATPAETTPENNRRHTLIRVARDKARVLLVDGEARWEFHYLYNALLRDKMMEPEAVVFWQPRIGQIKPADLDKSGLPKTTFPALPKEPGKGDPLAKYDCIILGDVTPEQLPLAERRRLEKYVADRGGTLVLLAGQRGLPLAFVPTGKQAEPDPLYKLLPIDAPRVLSPAEPFAVTLTQEGITTPYLQMDSEAEISALRWAELPKHYWAVIGKAKPGATPLAYVKGEQFRSQQGDARDAGAGPERTQALIVTQSYGFGRVVYVGLDSTWRWRFRTGDLYHHRFWGQLIRWAASDKLLPAGNKFARYGSRDPVYQQGREVEVVARLEDETIELPPGAVARARLLRQQESGQGSEEKLLAVLTLTPSAAQPRVLQGQVRDLPSGQYRIELDIPALAGKLKLPDEDEPGKEGGRRDIFLVQPSESGELYRLATDWDRLRAIAGKSGGRLLTPDQANALVDLFNRRIACRSSATEQRLWQDQPLVWYFLGGFLVLLTSEWVTRKWAGLP